MLTAYLIWLASAQRVGEGGMPNSSKALANLVTQSARPDWTLAAISVLIAVSIVASIRYAFE